MITKAKVSLMISPRVEGSVLVKEVETDIWESGPLVLTNVGGKD